MHASHFTLEKWTLLGASSRRVLLRSTVDESDARVCSDWCIALGCARWKERDADWRRSALVSVAAFRRCSPGGLETCRAESLPLLGHEECDLPMRNNVRRCALRLFRRLRIAATTYAWASLPAVCFAT